MGPDERILRRLRVSRVRRHGLEHGWRGARVFVPFAVIARGAKIADEEDLIIDAFELIQLLGMLELVDADLVLRTG